jgi:hypothetical protein
MFSNIFINIGIKKLNAKRLVLFRNKKEADAAPILRV